PYRVRVGRSPAGPAAAQLHHARARDPCRADDAARALLPHEPRPQVSARQLVRLVREHWHIENRLHYVRDVTLGKDASRVRAGSAPQALAAWRNTLLGLFRKHGYANMATPTSLWPYATSLGLRAPPCASSACVLHNEKLRMFLGNTTPYENGR